MLGAVLVTAVVTEVAAATWPWPCAGRAGRVPFALLTPDDPLPPAAGCRAGPGRRRLFREHPDFARAWAPVLVPARNRPRTLYLTVLPHRRVCGWPTRTPA
ncbi:hypothetical protein GCM10020358_24230 [Amorphoplanes nipponensis]